MSNCDQSCKIKLYNALVRSLLEYSCSSWACHTAANIYKLEKIQRKAARFVTADYKRCSSVTAMYTKLGWKELKTRRDYLSLKNFYCVVAQFGGWHSLG